MIKILIIAAIICICYYLPKGFNDFFEDKYGEKAVLWPFAAISVVVLVLSVFLGCEGGWVFWVLFSIFALVFIFTLVCCGLNAKKAGATVVEVIVAVIMQILATIGIVVFVVLTLSALNNLDKRRKK